MDAGTAMRSVRYASVTDRSPVVHVLRETPPAEAPKPKLLDRLRHAVRARHYSRRTEKAYVHWAKRYILPPLPRTRPSTRFCSSIARFSASSCRGSTTWSEPSARNTFPPCSRATKSGR